jgi:hypothetical protein
MMRIWSQSIKLESFFPEYYVPQAGPLKKNEFKFLSCGVLSDPLLPHSCASEIFAKNTGEENRLSAY